MGGGLIFTPDWKLQTLLLSYWNTHFKCFGRFTGHMVFGRCLLLLVLRQRKWTVGSSLAGIGSALGRQSVPVLQRHEELVFGGGAANWSKASAFLIIQKGTQKYAVLNRLLFTDPGGVPPRHFWVPACLPTHPVPGHPGTRGCCYKRRTFVGDSAFPYGKQRRTIALDIK
jgi:hypothetical protein